MAGFWQDWQRISADKASGYPHFGFGGWMWAFYIFAILRILLALRNIFGNETALGQMYELSNVGAIRILLVMRILLLVPFLVLAPLRHSSMPYVTIACAWAIALLAFLFGLIVSLPQDRLISVSLLEIVIAVGYTVYLLRSKRVNVTYLSLVPAKA